MGRITNQEPRYQSTHLLLQFNLHSADEVRAKRAKYTILVILFASEAVEVREVVKAIFKIYF